MALALYRKYRPRTFAEVIGQEHVTEPLSQALRSGRLHHAYLFSGPRGCGKTSSARILARSLNCEQGPTPEPCGVCGSCRSLMTDGAGSIDVIEIDAASHGGVDDARDLREKAFFAPASSRYKIYVIDEAHMVSPAGFNALLKLVEEPPDYVKFIFATTEPEKVLGTIRSRTHHYPFRLIPPATLRPYLQQLTEAEGVSVEPAVFPLVVRAGGGSARDTLSVLDQLIAGSGPDGVSYSRAVALLGVTDVALLDEMCDALAAGDGAAAYATIDRVAEAGHDPRRFASDLLERLRDLIILQQVPDAVAKGLIDGPADQLDAMTAQATRLGPATLSRCADIVHNGLVEMRGTTAPRLLLELVTARMLLPGADDTTGALLQRLERMERRLTLSGDQVPPAVRDEHPQHHQPPQVSGPAGPAVAAPSAGAPGAAAVTGVPSGNGVSDSGPAGGGGLSAARAAAAAAASRRASGGPVAPRPALAATVVADVSPSSPAPQAAPIEAVLIEAAAPQVSSPQVSSPQVSSPQVSSPQVSSPQVSSPQVSSPQVSSPQVSSPQVSSPQVSSPQVSSPQVSSPQVSSPQVSSPQVSSPQVGPPGAGADRGGPANEAVAAGSSSPPPAIAEPDYYDDEPPWDDEPEPELEPIAKVAAQEGVEPAPVQLEPSRSVPAAEPPPASAVAPAPEPQPQTGPQPQPQTGPQTEPEPESQPAPEASSPAPVNPPTRRAEPAGVLPDAPEEPGAAAVAAAVPGRLDVTAIREVWPEIITAVGRQSKKVAALASGATVREFDGQTVVLTFRFPTHARMVAPEAPLIANALYEALGGRWQIRCDVAGEAGAVIPGPSASGPSAAPEAGPDRAVSARSTPTDARSEPTEARSTPTEARSEPGETRSEPGEARPAQTGPPPAPQRPAQADGRAAPGLPAQATAPSVPAAQAHTQATQSAPRAPQNRRPAAESAPASGGDDDWPEPARPGGSPAAVSAPVEAIDEEEDWPEVRAIGIPDVADNPGQTPAGLSPATSNEVSASVPQADRSGSDQPVDEGTVGPWDSATVYEGGSEPIAPGSAGLDMPAPSTPDPSTPAPSTHTPAQTAPAQPTPGTPNPAAGGGTGLGEPGSGGTGLGGPGSGGTGLGGPGSGEPAGAGSGGGSAAGGPGLRVVERGSGLAAARAAAAGARGATAARQGVKPAGQEAWADGSPTEEAPYDPEYDGPAPADAGAGAGGRAPLTGRAAAAVAAAAASRLAAGGGAGGAGAAGGGPANGGPASTAAARGGPANGAASRYEGFDPGDEPLDVVIDEKTARESGEQQAVRLLQEAFGAEKIGES